MALVIARGRGLVIAPSALIVEHPRAAAADPRAETLFVARGALKRAIITRRDAELQVEQLRTLVARLEAAR